MFEKLSIILNKIAEYFTMILMGSMLVIILIQVVSRYIIGKSTPWTAEIAMYLMVWIALVGSSIIIKEEKHAAILFFIKKFSDRNKIIVKLLNNLVIIIFLIALITGGLRYAINHWNSISPATGLRRTWGYLSLSVGGSLMLFQVLFNSYKGITSLITGEYEVEIKIIDEDLGV